MPDDDALAKALHNAALAKALATPADDDDLITLMARKLGVAPEDVVREILRAVEKRLKAVEPPAASPPSSSSIHYQQKREPVIPLSSVEPKSESEKIEDYNISIYCGHEAAGTTSNRKRRMHEDEETKLTPEETPSEEWFEMGQRNGLAEPGRQTQATADRQGGSRTRTAAHRADGRSTRSRCQ
jgi:hypothetical protein